MIRRLYDWLATFAVATLLALVAFGGYLLVSGRLTAEGVDRLARALRGELVDPATLEPPPVADEPVAEVHGPAAGSAEALATRRDLARVAGAQVERSLQDVLAQRELLELATQELIQQTEAFERYKRSWENQRAKLQQETTDAGFEQELKLVSKLDPRQAKEHLLLTWKSRPADAVRLMRALTTSRAQRILDQLKTPEEMRIMHELLERLRETDIDQLGVPAGTAGR
jgi:hypothetical protein